MTRLLQLLTLSALLLLSPVTSKATHLLGGEITWECISRGPNKGKFIFEMRLYRACYQGAAGVGGSASIVNPLFGTYGGPSSISLVRVEVNDLVGNCYDTNRIVPCGVTIANGGDIAFDMNVYRSSPVRLNGIPAVTGSVFYWSSCCRPGPLLNMNGNTGYWLRSVMYPYRDPSTGNFKSLGSTTGGASCYDSSPRFTALPKRTICMKQNEVYWVSASDPCDSLVYDWEAPRVNATTPITWKLFYNDTLQLPSKLLNTLNSNPTLDRTTGKISAFVGADPGQGYHSIGTKVSSYKNGQLVAEVFKDVALSIVNCDTSNQTTNQIRNRNIPDVAFREKGSASWLSSYSKTYHVGEVIELDIRAQDFDSLPTNPIDLQSVSIEISGSAAANAPNDSTSCQNSPCAYLDSNNLAWNGEIFIDTTELIVKFRWNTNCLNLTRTSCVDDGHRRSTHVFSVKAMDNYCYSGSYETTFTIILEDTNTTGVSIDTIDASNGGALVSWLPYTGSGFVSYSVWRSEQYSGSWTMLSATSNINQTRYYDLNASTEQNIYYYTVRLDHSPFCLENNSSRNIVLNSRDSGSFLNLDWNLPYYPAPSGITGTYLLEKQVNNNGWNQLATQTLGNETYTDNLLFYTTLNYRVSSTDTKGLYAMSNVIEVYVDPFLSIKDNTNQISYMVYPIPARDELFIELNEGKEIYPIQINLLNSQGRTCYTGSLNATRTRIDLSGMAPGVYLIRFKSRDGQLSTGRFVLSD